MKRENSENKVPSLNDSCFNEMISVVCEEFNDEIGRKPTISEFCELLSISIRNSTSDWFDDISPDMVERITPKIKNRKSKRVSISPGDVFAIPRGFGGFYRVLFITKNRNGCAFGIFSGFIETLNEKKEFVANSPLSTVYSGSQLITEGRWKRICKDPGLLQYFPSEPEIYHARLPGLSYDYEIGEFGSASTPLGTLRDLTEDEAIGIGLNTTYRQFFLDEQLERFLEGLIE